MKYNKGDRFIVEIKEVIESDNGRLYRSNFKTLTFDDNGLDKLEKLDVIKDKMVRKCVADDYRDEAFKIGHNNGLNDAWELSRKVFSLNRTERKKAFGCEEIRTVVDCFNVKEALNMLEAYEKAQTEIKVGDVVEQTGTENRYLIITEENDSSVYDFGVIDLDAMKVDRISNDTRYFKKTGKHIDIQPILEQIGE